MINLKRIKRVTCIFCCMMCIAIACSATAYAAYGPSTRGYVPLVRMYSEEVTLEVPSLNRTVSTKSIDEYVFKASEDDKCTFSTINNSTAAGADARLINSDGVKRSAWARDLLTDTVRTANTKGATKGYIYYAQISSDLLEFQSFDITFKFSPDNMTTS